MTYGIKRTNEVGAVSIFTTTSEWECARYFGAGASFSAKQWKTRSGAQKNADRFSGAVVFTITDNVMNYGETTRDKVRQSAMRILRDHGLKIYELPKAEILVIDENPFSGTRTRKFSSLVQAVDHYKPIIQDDALTALYTG